VEPRPSSDGTPETSTLHDYTSVIRRRKWVILLALLVAPFAAVLVSLTQEPLYQASAQVYIRNPDLIAGLVGLPPRSVDPERVAATQAEIARAPVVAKRVLTSLGLTDRTAEDFLSSSSVSAKQNADLLDFRVTDPDRRLALRLATAYAREFSDYQRELDTAAIATARGRIQERINELAAGARGALYASLIERAQELETLEALQSTNTSLVQPAEDPAQVQPRVLRNAFSGLALGLVLGTGLAFLFDALDSRPRSEKEVRELLQQPLLGRVPAAATGASVRRLPTLDEPDGVVAERFRILRASFEFRNRDLGASVVMVTSSVRREGKSAVVANLAVALARAGRRVALIDLDLRDPSMEELFKLKGKPGLSEIALKNVEIGNAIWPISLNRHGGRRASKKQPRNTVGKRPATLDVTDFYSPKTLNTAVSVSPNLNAVLEVLPAGRTPSKIGNSVDTRSLGSILDEVRGRFDLVLIDAPPLLGLGDAIALTSHVDALIVVARPDLVRRPMLNELRRVLDTSAAAELGFVLVTDESEDDGSYYHRLQKSPDRRRKRTGKVVLTRRVHPIEEFRKRRAAAETIARGFRQPGR
jgi:polysaccharide biosynthesis transport protein